MVARPTLALLLATSVLVPKGATAQDCELQYRTSDAPQPYHITLDAGELRALDANFMTEALNVGENDLLIEIAIGGSRSEHRLIAVEDETVVLPPAAFTAVQLVDVLCTSHASYEDAQAYIETLEGYGATASAIYQDALADALAAAEEARDDALAVFDTLQAQQWVESTEPMLGDAQARWKKLQGMAPRVPSRKLTLEGDFPWLTEAIEATVAYTGSLPGEMESARNRLVALTEDLQAFQEEYMGEGSGAPTFQFDAQQQFPELYALSNWSCTLDDAPVVNLHAELTGIQQTLRELDDRYGFSDRAAATATLPQLFLDAIDFATSRGWCDGAREAMAEAAEADKEAYQRWKDNVERVRSRLGSRTVYLSTRDRAELDRLDLAVQQRHREARDACRRSRGADRRAASAREVLADESATPGERRRAFRDIARTHSVRRACRQANRRYRGARNDYERRFRSASAAAERRGARTTDQRSLARVYASYPESSFDEALIEAAESCATRLEQFLTRGLNALQDMPEPLPPGVSVRLSELIAANDRAFAATLPNIGTVREVLSSYGRARTATRQVGPSSGTRVRVGSQVILIADPQSVAEATSDPWAAFQSRLEDELDAIPVAGRNLENGVSKLSSELEAAGRSLSELTQAGEALGAAVGREGGRVGQDIQELVTRVAGVPRLKVSADRSASQAGACVSNLNTALADAQGSLDSRIQAYAELVEASMAPQVPQGVRTAYDELMAHGETLNQALADLEARNNAAYEDLQALAIEVYRPREPLKKMFPASSGGAAAGFPDVCKVPAPPAPFAPAPCPTINANNPYPPALDQRRTDSQASASTFSAAVGKFGVAQNQFAEGLEAFAGELDVWGDGGTQQAVDLTWSGIDPGVVDAANSRVSALSDAWGEAADRTPDQVAAVVPTAMAYAVNEASEALQAAFAQAQTARDELQACFAEGSQAARSLADVELVQSVAEAAVEGIETEAENVLSSLESFLSPTTGIFDDLEIVLDAAESLMNQLESSAEDARQAYVDQTSMLRSEADASRQCTAGSHFQLTEQMNQIGTMLDDLEETLALLKALDG